MTEVSSESTRVERTTQKKSHRNPCKGHLSSDIVQVAAPDPGEKGNRQSELHHRNNLLLEFDVGKVVTIFREEYQREEELQRDLPRAALKYVAEY